VGDDGKQPAKKKRGHPRKKPRGVHNRKLHSFATRESTNQRERGRMGLLGPRQDQRRKSKGTEKKGIGGRRSSRKCINQVGPNQKKNTPEKTGIKQVGRKRKKER